MTRVTTKYVVANLLCYHDIEDSDGEVCIFEGDVIYRVTLEGGQPDGPAETVCPDCGATSYDDGVAEYHMDYELAAPDAKYPSSDWF